MRLTCLNVGHREVNVQDTILGLGVIDLGPLVQWIAQSLSDPQVMDRTRTVPLLAQIPNTTILRMVDTNTDNNTKDVKREPVSR